jgi:hypothetical protein
MSGSASLYLVCSIIDMKLSLTNFRYNQIKNKNAVYKCNGGLLKQWTTLVTYASLQYNDAISFIITKLSKLI